MFNALSYNLRSQGGGDPAIVSLWQVYKTDPPVDWVFIPLKWYPALHLYVISIKFNAIIRERATPFAIVSWHPIMKNIYIATYVPNYCYT